MSDKTDSAPVLPPEVLARMHATWERAFIEGAGLDTDAGAAADEFVSYALALLAKVHGKRDVSRRLYLMAQLFAAQADAETFPAKSQH